MSLTPTQKEWANAQIGTEIETVLDGTITKKSGRKGEYTMEVVGNDGTATFVLATEDLVLADKHLGIESSVKVEGKVTSVTLDEDGGRVGLVITGDNGTVTEWHVPEMSDAEIEAARPPEPEPPTDKEISDNQVEEEKNAVLSRRGNLISLLTDPMVRDALRRAVAPNSDTAPDGGVPQ